MNGWILEEQDREGHLVRLKADRWELHIIEKHPEVAPYLDAIRALIKKPQIITKDRGGSVHLARLGAVTGKWKNLYLEIVVRYNRVEDKMIGDIKTIHFNAMPPKGELKWIARN